MEMLIYIDEMTTNSNTTADRQWIHQKVENKQADLIRFPNIASICAVTEDGDVYCVFLLGSLRQYF